MPRVESRALQSRARFLVPYTCSRALRADTGIRLLWRSVFLVRALSSAQAHQDSLWNLNRVSSLLYVLPSCSVLYLYLYLYSVYPCHPVGTDDRKQFQCLNMALNNKSRPLFLKHVLYKQQVIKVTLFSRIQ